MADRLELGLVAPGNYGWEIAREVFPRWPSKYVSWVSRETDLLTVYVDTPVGQVSKYSVAVIGEPMSLFKEKEWNQYLESIAKADLILTYYEGVLERFKWATYYPGGGLCFIAPDNRRIYPKSKMTSSTFSDKWFTAWHNKRHEVMQKFSHKIESSRPASPDKTEALADFRYHVAIENEPTHFTEKLLDCFVTGTIPIYCGPPQIGNLFNPAGILQFDTMDELELILDKISPEYYESRIPAIEDNFQRAQRFLSPGDVYWKYGIERLLQSRGEI